MSLKSVQAPIREFAKLIDVNLATVCKTLTLELFNAITLRTPVDTGRARASWQVSQKTIPKGAPKGKFSSSTSIAAFETVTASAMPAIAQITGTEVIYIVSNLDYIEPLENGHSAQAPVGMVQISVAEAAAKIKLMVKKLKT